MNLIKNNTINKINQKQSDNSRLSKDNLFLTGLTKLFGRLKQ